MNHQYVPSGPDRYGEKSEFFKEMNSYYWYQRLLPLLPGPLTTMDWDPEVDWQQVYNILRVTRWDHAPTSPEGMKVIEENDYNRVALSILKAMNVPLGPTLEGIIASPSSLRSDAVEGCLELSSLGVTEISLLGELKTHSSNFNKHHFNMLLKQLIFYRRNRTSGAPSEEDDPRVPVSTNGVGLAHYINWILIQLNSPGTSREVKLLFGAAADSILYDERVKHTSVEFTAYSCFLLLAFTTDWKHILEAAKEEGASSNGIELAGMLLGAFLGKRRLLTRA